MFITSPNKFAALFNERLPDTHRNVIAEDIICMKKCKHICRHGFYIRDDLETVRGILLYEQMRDKESIQQPVKDKKELPKCKMCEQPLPPEPANKTGRPKEYCSGCELLRTKERNRKWRARRKMRQKHLTEIRVVHNYSKYTKGGECNAYAKTLTRRTSEYQGRSR